jgi:hypothetical protein
VNNIIFNNTSFTNGSGSLAPVISTGGLPEPRNNPVRDVFDNLTWTKGRHTFTFGGDFRSSSSHDLSISNPPAATMGISTAYDPANSMFNTANFPALNVGATNQQDLNNAKLLYAVLTGRLTSISGQNAVDSASGQYKVLGDLVLQEAQNVGGFYMQDSWRPTPHLALNYGLRWQFSGTVHNTNNIYTSPTLADLQGPSTAPFQPGTLNGITNPQIYLRPTNYGADLNQAAPNFGFAYNPAWNDGKLVLRGGAAISRYDEGWITWETASDNNPGLRQTASLTAGPTNSSSQFAAGTLALGATPSLYTTPATFSFPLAESAFTYASGGNLYTVDPKIRSPYIENWYVGFQYKLPANFVVETNYVANHSVHMWDAFNINETNIYENGFLAEFQRAQAHSAATGGKSFAGPDLPIMNTAFGSTTASAFTNATYLNYVNTGQAGALANVISSTSSYFCNLVGNGGGIFTPCNRVYGKTAGTGYATNFFVQNPFSTGTSSTAAMELSDKSGANYEGLQVQLKHPAGHHLLMMANYAYSHAFTDRYANSDSGTNNYITLRNPYLNHGPSPSDLRNVFRGYAVYTLPFQSHNAILKEFVNGWTLSPLVAWQTGRNFKLVGGTSTVNTSDSGVVLTGLTNFELQKYVGKFHNTAGDSSKGNSTPILLMNPSVLPAAGSGKSVNSVTTPGAFGQFVFLKSPQYVDTDLSITKDFPIFERLKFNIQAELINILNHPNFAAGSTDAPAQTVSIQGTTSTVPSITAYITGGPRTIQFRAQVAF